MHVVYIVTQTVFILGKVFGYLDWSWLLVFAPTYVIIGMLAVSFALVLAVSFALAYCYYSKTKRFIVK